MRWLKKLLYKVVYETLCGVIIGLTVGGVIYMVLEAKTIEKHGVHLHEALWSTGR